MNWFTSYERGTMTLKLCYSTLAQIENLYWTINV
jgi:hypothetical protein